MQIEAGKGGDRQRGKLWLVKRVHPVLCEGLSSNFEFPTVNTVKKRNKKTSFGENPGKMSNKKRAQHSRSFFMVFLKM
jgi:hypothetical protein